MSKTLLMLLLTCSVSATYAQNTGGSDYSGKSRAEVKADNRAANSQSTMQTEYTNPPSTKGSGTSRVEVKAAERASGAMGTKQIEYADTGKWRRGDVVATDGAPIADPFAQSRNEKAQAKSEYRQEKAKERAEYRNARHESQAKLKITNQRSDTEKNLEVPK